MNRILFFLFLSSFLGINAQIVLNDGDLNRRVESAYYLESGKGVSINTILTEAYQIKFKKNKSKSIMVEKPDMEYWIKIPYEIESDAHWLFQTFTVHADSIDIYIPGRKGYRKNSLGTFGDERTREIKVPEIIFELERLSGQQNIYLRVKSKNPVKIECLFRTEAYFINFSSRENLFRGLFHGLVSGIGLLAFFLFLYSRRSIYLIYAVYIFSVLFYSLVQSGIGDFFIWHNYSTFNFVMLRYLGLPLVVILSFFYSLIYLLEDKISKKLMVGVPLAMVFFVVVESLNFFPAYTSMAVGVSLVYGVLIYFIVKMKKWSHTFDRYFVFGFSFMVLGVLFVFLRITGIVESNIYTYYIFHIGLMAEVTLFSIALAGKHNQVNVEREDLLIDNLTASQQNEVLQKDLIGQLEENQGLQTKVQRELEEKVSERTEELEALNSNLERLVTDLESMNIHLDKDNWKLKKENKESLTGRFKNTTLNIEEFQKIFPDEFSCKKFLGQLKWSGGFSCVKCDSEKYYDGTQKLARKCSSCAHEESVTAGTIFKGLKFSLQKSFYIAHLVMTHEKITIKELTIQLELNEETCRRFRKKVMDRVTSLGQKNPSEREVFLIND